MEVKVQSRSGSEFDLSEIGDVFESDLIVMHQSHANTLKVAFDFNSVSSYLGPGKCSSLGQSYFLGITDVENSR